MPKNEPFMMELKCILTDEDKATISSMIVGKLSEKEDFENEKSSATAKWGAKIKEINKEIASLARCHREGQEMRQVECYTHFDWSTGIATVYRTDTQAIVSTRTITSQERQRQIDDQQIEADSVDGEVDGEQEAAQGQTDIVQGQENPAGGESIPDGGEVEGSRAEMPKGGDRKNEALRELLTRVMQKAPTLKTIELYTDAQFEQVRQWAAAVYLNDNGNETVEIPMKPAFIGKLKKKAS